MQVNLQALTQELFVELDQSVLNYYRIDQSDAANPYVEVNGAKRFPLGKDYMMDLTKGLNVTMPGLAVFAPATGKVYLSKEGLDC